MIEIKNISFGYDKNAIFTDYSAVIANNSMTLLGGPNGSGKTTLLQLIGGIHQPSSGQIVINGHDISKLSAREAAELRSAAPQRRVFELAFTVAELFKIIKKPAAHAADLYEALDLYDLFPAKVTELSLGQQQRVSVALALLQDAQFYLLDEPFSAQDSIYTQKLIDFLTVISKQNGVMVISHNTGHLLQYFDENIYLT